MMRKNTYFLLGGIAGFLLVSLLAFGLWYLALSHRQSPEEIFLMSIQKMAKVNSYSVSGEITFKTSAPFASLLSPSQSKLSKPQYDAQSLSPQKSTLQISGNGASSRKDPLRPKGFFALQVKIDDPKSQINAKASIDARIDGETIYFKLHDVDFSNTPFAAFSRFAGSWIQGNLTALTKQYIGDSAANRIGEASATQLFSAKELSQLADIAEQTKPFLVRELADSAEGGYHLKVTPQGEGVRKFLLSSLNFFRQKGFQEGVAPLRNMLQNPSFVQQVDQFAKQSKFELWIDKTSLLFRKVFFTLNFEDGNFAEVTLALGKYDQDVLVTFPSDSTPIDQILQEILSSLASPGDT